MCRDYVGSIFLCSLRTSSLNSLVDSLGFWVYMKGSTNGAWASGSEDEASTLGVYSMELDAEPRRIKIRAEAYKILSIRSR